MPELIEDASNELPGSFRLLVQRLMEQLKELHRQAGEIETQIAAWHRDSALSRKLAAVPGIGPITASALVATVGDAKNFANGRQLAAWLGLVPRQNSSGGKNVLLGISKRGDTYLRTLLIHGARSVIFRAAKKAEGWLHTLIGRRNANVAQGGFEVATQPSDHTQGDSNHRLLRRSCSDGKTGQTVVGTARAGRGTQSACKRSRSRPANPIRDSEFVSHQSPDVRVQSSPSRHHELRAWQTGGVHVRPAVAS